MHSEDLRKLLLKLDQLVMQKHATKVTPLLVIVQWRLEREDDYVIFIATWWAI